MIQKTFGAGNGKTLIMKGLNPIQFCLSIFLFLLISHVCHEVSSDGFCLLFFRNVIKFQSVFQIIQGQSSNFL